MRQVPAAASLLTLAALAMLGLGAPTHASAAGASADAGNATTATQAATITREATPDWITLRDLPEATPARMEPASKGIAYLLTDVQTRVRADGHDEWFRTASKVVERSGLEASGQLDVSFNPHFEQVAIHFIHIIRNGKVIDLTPETRFRVVEREDSLDDGIVSGTLKAVANLRDVRVGDVIDFAYSTHAQTSLWPGQFFDHFSERYSDPLALHAVRYVWPTGTAPQMKALNSTLAFTTRKSGDTTQWEWIAQDPPAQQGENDVPDTAYQWGTVDISTMRGWGDLAQWGARLYVGDDGLTPDFLARLDTIAKDHPAPADRLTEVTRYLQDAIRYVGEEMGEGSYVPRRPRVVLERGYGDCKDKSLLLAVALRHLGIEATPALVSTTRGDTLADRLPSPLLFDHVIVRAVVDGKVVWIDATGTHRGGRGLGLVPADFGYALPLRTGQSALEKMEGYAAHAGRMAVRESFAVDEKGAEPLTLNVETTYTEGRADAMRAHVADASAKTIARDNLEFYRKRFAGLVESKPIEIRDDRDANRVVMVESYRLPRADFDKDKITDKLITRAYAVTEKLPERQASPRQQPLALTPYIDREQVIELRAKDRKLWLPDAIETKASGISFTRQSRYEGDTTSITYRLTTGSTLSVPAKDADAVYAIADKIKDEGGLEFYISKSGRANDSEFAGLDPNAMASIRADVSTIASLMQKGDEASAIEGLTLLNTAAAKVKHPSPEAGLLDGLKGALLVQLRRNGPALAALQSATDQYDGNPEVYKLWLAYRIDAGDWPATLKALRRSLKAQPKVVTNLDQRWVGQIYQSLRKLPPAERDQAHQDLCIVLSDADWQMEPRTTAGSSNLACAIDAHSRRGELDQARAGMARNPGAQALAGLALDRRHQALWPDSDRLGADGFRKAMEQDAERAAAAAKAAPGNAKLLTDQMRALRKLGRYGEALALGKPIAANKAQIETIGDDAFWLVNEYANNLSYSGHIDDAIATFDSLLSLGIASYPQLVSMAINRATVLNDAGRHDRALAAVLELENNHLDQISPYGRMFVWAEHACALHALGRGDEAKAVEAKMAAKPDDNWAAMSRAAACRKDVPALATILITRLRDESERGGALGLFVRFRNTETILPYEAQLRATVQAATQTPAVQAEFQKVGRVITYAGNHAGWQDY